MQSRNNGFTTTTNKVMSKGLTSVSEIDPTTIKIGEKTKNKNGTGNHIPVMAKGKNGNPMPLQYQARGVLITFAGCSKKSEAETSNPLERKYSMIIDGVKDECEFLPGGKGDGPALLNFQREFDAVSRRTLDDKGKAWNLKKAELSPDVFGYKYSSLVSEGTFKKDKDGKPTTEKYNAGLSLPLRLQNDKDGKKLNKFTTRFINAETKQEITDVTCENVREKIPYGTMAILTINQFKYWVGENGIKPTVYIDEAKLLFPKKNSSYGSDDFINVGSEDFVSTPETKVRVSETPVPQMPVDDFQVDQDLEEAFKNAGIEN